MNTTRLETMVVQLKELASALYLTGNTRLAQQMEAFAATLTSFLEQ